MLTGHDFPLLHRVRHILGVHDVIAVEHDLTKDNQTREIPLPEHLVLMLERIEPKQRSVFDTTKSARNRQSLVPRWVWAVSSQWKAGRTIRGMKV